MARRLNGFLKRVPFARKRAGAPVATLKDHRIEKPVRVIENENQGLPRRNPVPSLDDAGGIVEADQRLSQPPK